MFFFNAASLLSFMISPTHLFFRLSAHRIQSIKLLRIRTFTMPSNNPEARNASGLTPSETKNLKTRQAEPHEDSIIQCIKEVNPHVKLVAANLTQLFQLYSCQPTEVSMCSQKSDQSKPTESGRILTRCIPRMRSSMILWELRKGLNPFELNLMA